MGPDGRRFAETRDASSTWEGHKAGMEVYCHLEKLANLDKPPALVFRVCCFPVKAGRRVGRAPSRVSFERSGVVSGVLGSCGRLRHS